PIVRRQFFVRRLLAEIAACSSDTCDSRCAKRCSICCGDMVNTSGSQLVVEIHFQYTTECQPELCSLVSASPQILIVVVNWPGSQAVILTAMGMKFFPWYSGSALYLLIFPSAASWAM